jgi:hypothetical protein
MSPRPKGSNLSDAHKAALAEGRTQSKAVRDYLEALEAHKPKRGRKRTKDSIKKRLAAIDSELKEADPLRRVQLVQEQLDLATELEQAAAPVDLAALEAGFVASAKGYSERKGISYAAWRTVGITPSVLKKAGVSR